MSEQRLSFPRHFLWGTASAAHQVEGGNTGNDWWAFEQRPGAIWHGDRSDGACNWWHDAEQDFGLMAEMGLNSHRLSVEWSRIEPQEGSFDPAAIARYRQMLCGLRERGIEPMVTLFHFSSPLWLERQGGWTNPAAVGHFRRFVQHTVEQLGDLVRLWCTINEPNVYAAFGYLFGEHAPGVKSLPAYFTVLRHLLSLSHVIVEDRPSVEQALSLCDAGLALADALHHASYRGCTSMASFDDRRFARRAGKLGMSPSVIVPR